MGEHLGNLLNRKGRKTIVVKADATMQDVVEALDRYHIGALPVVDPEQRLIGIVTERDVLHLLARRRRLDEIDVGAVMAREVIVAREGDDLQSAMNTMTERRVRHLPIVRGDALVGIVSIGDVVNALRKTDGEEITHLREYIYGYAEVRMP